MSAYHQAVMNFEMATLRKVCEALPLKPSEAAMLFALSQLAPDRTEWGGPMREIGAAMKPAKGLSATREAKAGLLKSGFVRVIEQTGQPSIYQIDWQRVFASDSGSSPKPNHHQTTTKPFAMNPTGPHRISEGTPPVLDSDPTGYPTGPHRKSHGTPPDTPPDPTGNRWGHPTGPVGLSVGCAIDAHAPPRHGSKPWLLNSKAMDPWVGTPPGKFPLKITREQLRDPAAVGVLFGRAVALGWVPAGTETRWLVFRLAAHSCDHGRTPGAMFRKNLERQDLFGDEKAGAWATWAIAEVDRAQDQEQARPELPAPMDDFGKVPEAFGRYADTEIKRQRALEWIEQCKTQENRQ